MDNNHTCRSNNNSNNVILHGHFWFSQAPTGCQDSCACKNILCPTKSHYCTKILVPDLSQDAMSSFYDYALSSLKPQRPVQYFGSFPEH